jgi:hypothetical protein
MPTDIMRKYEALMEKGIDSVIENITTQIEQREQEAKRGLPPPEERGESYIQLVPEWEKMVIDKIRLRLAREAAREKHLRDEQEAIRPDLRDLSLNFTYVPSPAMRKGVH